MEFKGSEVTAYVMRGLIFSVIFWALWQFAGNFNVLPNTKAVSAFYPAPALTMALVSVFGWRYLPIVFFAACFGNAPDVVPWDQPTFIWFNNLRQVLIYGAAGLVLARLLQGERKLDNSRNVLTFVGLSFVTAFISACLALWIYHIFKVIPEKIYMNVFFSFWAGDMTGIMMVAPLAVLTCKAWKSNDVGYQLSTFLKAYSKQVLIAILVPALIAAPAFSYIIKTPDASGYGYLIIIPIVWIAATMGATFGSIAALCGNLAAAGAYAYLNGSAYSPSELQVFFAVAAGLALIIGAARDDRMKAEGRVLEQEARMANMSRMASIGELGSTIAHEIATPLQTASINSQLSMKRLKEQDEGSFGEILDYQNEVQNAVKRAVDIHNRIREFSRGNSSITIQPTDVASCFKEAQRLLDRTFQQSRVSVKVSAPGQIPLANADPISMQQVFLNLLKNAVSAIEAAKSEVREISCILKHEGNRVIAEIQDSGPGLSKEAADRAFDSFYTTKEDGLGLGLAICRTTLEGLGGNIQLLNSDKGACFAISLPVYQKGEA